MCTARETPRGAAWLHGRGRGVWKAMRSPWGCRRGNPLVGLLGGQALAPSGMCRLPHAALSLREMPPPPHRGPGRNQSCPPARTPADSSWPSTPLPPATWSFLPWLVVHTPASCLPSHESHPRGPTLTTPSALLPKTVTCGFRFQHVHCGGSEDILSVATAHGGWTAHTFLMEWMKLKSFSS